MLAPLTRLTTQTRSAPDASSWSAWDAFSAPVRLQASREGAPALTPRARPPPPQGWRSGVVVITVLGGTFTAVFEAGRLHKSVAELAPKVQQVQASVDALRADVRADMGALRVSSDKLNDKMDQLLLCFLPKSE